MDIIFWVVVFSVGILIISKIIKGSKLRKTLSSTVQQQKEIREEAKDIRKETKEARKIGLKTLEEISNELKGISNSLNEINGKLK